MQKTAVDGFMEIDYIYVIIIENRKLRQSLRDTFIIGSNVCNGKKTTFADVEKSQNISVGEVYNVL